jgi:hypothetical protein
MAVAEILTTIGPWVSTILIIAFLSFVIKMNVVFRISEDLLIGTAVGYLAISTIDVVQKQVSTLVETADILLGICIILGVLLYLRFVPSYDWVPKYGIAVMVGVGTGLAIVSIMHTAFLNQIIATIQPVWTGDALGSFNNILMISIVICIIYFFIFTQTRLTTSTAGRTMARYGRYAMMLSFGAQMVNYIYVRFSILAQLFTLITDTIGITG